MVSDRKVRQLSIFAFSEVTVWEKRQLQVTFEETTSRSGNHVFILPGGKWLLMYVPPDRGIDCLYTLLKLKQCPVLRTAWMPTGAPYSRMLFDPTSFIIQM